MAAPVLRLRTPTGTGSERLPPKSANGSGANRRRGTRAAGRRRWRAGLPLVAITRVVARPKNKGKNKTAPQREKAGIAWASRWSGVTVRGDPTGCSASRWSAMGVVVLTAQNHFRLDRDRPSHGSRDRRGDGAFGKHKHKPPHHQKGNAGVSLYRAVKRPVHRSSGFVTERNLNVQNDGDFNSRPPRAGYLIYSHYYYSC
jgi:hypothetical protein